VNFYLLLVIFCLNVEMIIQNEDAPFMKLKKVNLWSWRLQKQQLRTLLQSTMLHHPRKVNLKSPMDQHDGFSKKTFGVSGKSMKQMGNSFVYIRTTNGKVWRYCNTFPTPSFSRDYYKSQLLMSWWASRS